MKRYIKSSEVIFQDDGFQFVLGNKLYFYTTTSHNITDKIVRKFINAVCDQKQVGDSIRQAALYSKPTLDDFRRRITRASLSQIDTGEVMYYSIQGPGSIQNFPEQDFNRDVVLLH